MPGRKKASLRNEEAFLSMGEGLYFCHIFFGRRDLRPPLSFAAPKESAPRPVAKEKALGTGSWGV